MKNNQFLTKVVKIYEFRLYFFTKIKCNQAFQN